MRQLFLLLSDVTDEISQNEYITAALGCEYWIKGIYFCEFWMKMNTSQHEYRIKKKLRMNTSLESLE